MARTLPETQKLIADQLPKIQEQPDPKTLSWFIWAIQTELDTAISAFTLDENNRQEILDKTLQIAALATAAIMKHSVHRMGAILPPKTALSPKKARIKRKTHV